MQHCELRHIGGGIGGKSQTLKFGTGIGYMDQDICVCSDTETIVLYYST